MSFVDALILLAFAWAIGTVVTAIAYAANYAIEYGYDKHEANYFARRMFTAYLWPFWLARFLVMMHRDAFEPQDKR